MGRKVTQRELRNESGAIMRGLDRGESYTVTRNGVPVGELTPVKRREYLRRDELAELFSGSPAVDWKAFKSDVRDWFEDNGPEPDPYDKGPKPKGPRK